jgi:hypothetical protein
MEWLAAFLLLFAAAADSSATFESAFSPQDFELSADPASPQWANAPRVLAERGYLGEHVAGAPTEIRSRWSRQNLYLLFVCPFDELNLKPNPNSAAETPGLWNWDVAEVFVGSDFEHIGRYKELQVSPQGEWVDLSIDREDPKAQEGVRWNSGYVVKARIDRQAKVWYGEMRIPFRAIDTRPPETGREFRMGLFRIAGPNPKKRYLWRPTGQTSFHVPQAFGTLLLN